MFTIIFKRKENKLVLIPKVAMHSLLILKTRSEVQHLCSLVTSTYIINILSGSMILIFVSVCLTLDQFGSL